MDFLSFEGFYAEIVFSLHAHSKHSSSICSFVSKNKTEKKKNRNDEKEKKKKTKLA